MTLTWVSLSSDIDPDLDFLLAKTLTFISIFSLNYIWIWLFF